MKQNITVIAFMIFMLAVSIFSVIIINLSNNDSDKNSYYSANVPDSSVSGAEVSESPNNTTTSPIMITSPDDTNINSLSKSTTSASTTEMTVSVPSFPMEINSADHEALIAVPGIGEVMADRIMNYKRSAGTIHDMNELLEINGIGEKTLATLKEYFYVSDKYTVTTTTVPASAISPSGKTSSSKRTAGTTNFTVSVPATTTTSAEPVRKAVSINTADTDELMRCLLITEEQANDIVALRTRIGGFVNTLEILYCDTISDSLFLELEPYLTL